MEQTGRSVMQTSLSRRQVLTGVFVGGGCLGFPLIRSADARREQTVTIVHTNDTHSRIDPFPDGKYKGLGGIAQRASLIAEIRRKNPATLVVDAGDILQGTPYFNLFHGQVEFETMRQAGYDVAAIGNHDFDAGSERLLYLARHYGRFPLLSANLQFSQSEAASLIRPYMIKEIGGWKIGLFGLGVRFRGLVPQKLHQGVEYLPPLAVAKRCVQVLREQHRCDAIVALSHLGYVGYDGEPGDQDLAREIPGIDIIIGGHTHTFLSEPTVVRNPIGETTRIYQVGHSGIYVGQIHISFHPKRVLEIQNQSTLVEPGSSRTAISP